MTDLLRLVAFHDNTARGCDIYTESGIYVARDMTVDCQGSDSV